MKKLRLFLENFLVYGLGGVISKLVPVIMVPIVTYIIPETAYYGLSDLSHTASSIGCSLATMGMYDAMYRMFFENDDLEHKRKVCSTTLCFTLSTSLLIALLMVVFKDFVADFFFKSREYGYLIYITAMATFVGATNNIIAAPTRMQNKRVIYLIANSVGPIIAYGISIPLLLKGYYVIAMPLAMLISGFVIEVTYFILNKKWFHFKSFDLKLLKPLLVIAIPLLPNFLIYWIFNSSDKLMITNLIGVEMAGVYAISSKLGHVSQIIYTAFAGGWQYFAFSTMKEGDQVKSNSKVFEYLAAISFIVTIFVCALSSTIFKILFKQEYYIGFISAPYLFLAPLLQMLFQVACNQFLVIKKTWPNMFILLGGALLNVFLNFKLIPILGIEGASIATLTGYCVSLIIGCVALVKMKLMIIPKRFRICCIVFVASIIIWRFMTPDILGLGILLAAICSSIILLIYKAEICFIVKIIYKKIRQRGDKK